MKLTFLAAFLCCSSFLVAQNGTPISPEQQIADSLFSAGQYKQALPLFEKVVKQSPTNSLEWNRLGFCYHNTGKYDEALNCYQKSLANNPGIGLKPLVDSRIAKVYSLQNHYSKAVEWIDSAVANGYTNLTDLETNADFTSLRTQPVYKEVHDRIYLSVYPCMGDSNSRKFDFWVGEWDAHPNGANYVVGKSKIEIASGGCMILENWTSIVNNYSGKSMNYYVPATGKWEQVWVGQEGSPNRPNHFVNGEYKDGAMRFEFSGKDQKGDYTGRFIFYNMGPDQVRQFNEQSYDGGKTWQTNYDLIYERKK